MDRLQLNIALQNGSIEWQRHALERMMERGISRTMVKDALINGEIIETYPDDKPFQSALFMGMRDGQPIHVVAAFDHKNLHAYVITAYKPDLEHFEDDYRTRRIDYGN